MTYSEVNALLHTVIIETTRMSELASFYGRGLDLGDSSPTGSDHLGLTLPNLYFGFDFVSKTQAELPGAVSLWFEVDDLEKVFRGFVALGAQLVWSHQETLGSRAGGGVRSRW
jgi:hypothetical protein